MTATGRHPRIGALILAVGAGIALMIHLHPENLRAPAWVAYAAAGAFGIAGLMLLAQARGWTRLQAALPPLLIACLLTPLLWIVAANPDGGRCRVDILGYSARAPEILCRAGLAVGAAIGLGILLLALRHAVRAWRARPGRSPDA